MNPGTALHILDTHRLLFVNILFEQIIVDEKHSERSNAVLML